MEMSQTLWQVWLYNSLHFSIINVNFYPPAEYYSIAEPNLIGYCHLDDVSVNLIALSCGVCGKGILLVYNDSVSVGDVQ